MVIYYCTVCKMIDDGNGYRHISVVEMHKLLHNQSAILKLGTCLKCRGEFNEKKLVEV